MYDDVLWVIIMIRTLRSVLWVGLTVIEKCRVVSVVSSLEDGLRFAGVPALQCQVVCVLLWGQLVGKKDRLGGSGLAVDVEGHNPTAVIIFPHPSGLDLKGLAGELGCETIAGRDTLHWHGASELWSEESFEAEYRYGGHSESERDGGFYGVSVHGSDQFNGEQDVSGCGCLIELHLSMDEPSTGTNECSAVSFLKCPSGLACGRGFEDSALRLGTGALGTLTFSGKCKGEPVNVLRQRF